MIITVEISYYPLSTDYTNPIAAFIEELSGVGLMIETGKMSSLITGEYDIVMEHLTVSMKKLMEQYPSVFALKISNSCLVY